MRPNLVFVVAAAIFVLHPGAMALRIAFVAPVPRGGGVHTSNSKRYAGQQQGKNTYQKKEDANAASKEQTHHIIKPALFYVTKVWTRILYIVTAINPALAVLSNDYSAMIKYAGIQSALARTYETIFFFAKLRPRVTFSIGAALRALQLCTPFQLVFDPSAGVGFGLNIICLFCKSRWPATVVLGWALTKPAWKVLGGCPPAYRPVPIAVSISKKSPPPTTSDNQQQFNKKGYRLGI